MTEAGAPELTVWYDGSAHTFVAGDDVIVGRDIRADLRVPEPLISRAHLVLRFDQSRWVAIDNDSVNGMYVQGRRVAAVDLEDGHNINVGSLVGPLLTFEVGRPGPAEHPPPSAVLAGSQQTAVGPAPRHAKGQTSSSLVTSLRKIHLPGASVEPPPGSATIGDHHPRTGAPRTHPRRDAPGRRRTQPPAAEAGLTYFRWRHTAWRKQSDRLPFSGVDSWAPV